MRVTGLMLLMVLTCVSAALADEPASTAPFLANRPGRGLLTHDEHRYGQRWNLPVGLLLRSAMDLVAIPSGVVAWDAKDWGLLAGVAAVTAGLSLPLGPSPDVAIQRGVQRALGGQDHLRLWTQYGDMAIWFTIYSALASSALYGLLYDAPEYVEVSALALEAFLVAQVFHWSLKALAGRDGPERNVPPGELSSDGQYHGPAGFQRPFGSGTPSGHAASLYAVFSVVMHAVDTPAAWISLNLVGVLLGVALVADNYHFTSEVILGAVMGFCVGRWVTEHRSSRYRNGDDGLPHRLWGAVRERVTVLPLLLPGGAMGAGVSVRL